LRGHFHGGTYYNDQKTAANLKSYCLWQSILLSGIWGRSLPSMLGIVEMELLGASNLQDDVEDTELASR